MKYNQKNAKKVIVKRCDNPIQATCLVTRVAKEMPNRSRSGNDTRGILGTS